jgi:hypothetical protein
MKRTMNIMGLGDVEIDVELGVSLYSGGYVNAEHYKHHSIFMRENNPMKDPEVAKKNGMAKKGKQAWNKGIANPEQSKRMKTNNPTKKNPACTNTARPVEIHYEDGTIEKYDYLKEATKLKNIPYGTLQWCVAKKVGSKKWKIEQIIQKER